jgi:hypothetical protein
VTFSTSNGTAMGGAACAAGIDYVSVAGLVVTFNPGEASKTANVTVCGDSMNEPTQTVNLLITGPFTRPGEEPMPEAQNAVLNINDTASQFRNASPICVTAAGTGDVYPSTINVSGAPIAIGSMRVTLYDLYYTIPDHIDALLVGPGGQKFVIQGDAGGAISIPADNTVTLSLTDAASAVLPNSGPLVTGNFEPTTWEGPVSNFPAPAPAGPYNEAGSSTGGSGTQTFFGNYGHTNANGAWRLFIRDDAGTLVDIPDAISGCFAGGWGIEFFPSTAANASISGRVLTADGRAIRNATVTVTGHSLPEPIVTQTGSFGYYAFDGLRTGETYVVTVSQQRYTFQAPSRIVSLTDNIADLDFIAAPGGSVVDLAEN